MIPRLLSRWSSELGSDPLQTGVALLVLMALVIIGSLSSLNGGPQ